MIDIKISPVHPGAGRQIVHDDRSRNYPAPVREGRPKSVMHRLGALPVDQGPLGSCTGSASANLLNTRLMHAERKSALKSPRYLTQADAIDLYSRATQLDPWEGSYPPDDTGSSGLAVAQAMMERGFIREYRHCFGVEHMAKTVALQPVLVGTYWYEGMAFPKFKQGHFYAEPTGTPLSGHEYLCIGVNPNAGYFTFVNSWGPNWPHIWHMGRFRMTFDVMKQLLDDDGDVTVPMNWV